MRYSSHHQAHVVVSPADKALEQVMRVRRMSSCVDRLGIRIASISISWFPYPQIPIPVVQASMLLVCVFLPVHACIANPLEAIRLGLQGKEKSLEDYYTSWVAVKATPKATIAPSVVVDYRGYDQAACQPKPNTRLAVPSIWTNRSQTPQSSATYSTKLKAETPALKHFYRFM